MNTVAGVCAQSSETVNTVARVARGIRRGTFGRHQQRHVRGHRRSVHLHVRLSPQLQLALREMADVKHATVSYLVERTLWKGLSKEAARKGAKLFARMHHADALIGGIIAEVMVVRPAGHVKIPGQPEAENIHAARTRQLRRNRISQKVEAAIDEVYELAQTEALAEDNRARAVFYGLLAQLAQVDENILQGASDEEVLAEIKKLREDQERFEETTRKLEEEAEISPAT